MSKESADNIPNNNDNISTKDEDSLDALIARAMAILNQPQTTEAESPSNNGLFSFEFDPSKIDLTRKHTPVMPKFSKEDERDAFMFGGK